MANSESVEDSTGYWITRLARSMERDFEHRLRAIGITRGAYAVLSAVHHDKKTTPAELVKFLGLDGASVTRLLDRIEKDGLIQRKPSETDRRSIDIAVIQKGVRIARRGRAASKATNEKFTACLTAPEVARLQSTVRKMLDGVDATVSDL